MTSPTSCGTCGLRPHGERPVLSQLWLPGSRSGHACRVQTGDGFIADVVRSMDIASKVGAERLREIMGELINRATAVVERYGGTVDMFTGDGLMATFGATEGAGRSCLSRLSRGARRATRNRKSGDGSAPARRGEPAATHWPEFRPG